MFVRKTNDEKHFELIYTYLNNGSTEQNFPPHYGTETIKIIIDDDNSIKKLSGGYFTNREPQTKGSFKEMKWTNNNLNHNF